MSNLEKVSEMVSSLLLFFYNPCNDVSAHKIWRQLGVHISNNRVSSIALIFPTLILKLISQLYLTLNTKFIIYLFISGNKMFALFNRYVLPMSTMAYLHVRISQELKTHKDSTTNTAGEVNSRDDSPIGRHFLRYSHISSTIYLIITF